jgi:murein DD-endopeptidase MepM/ murein hydrolase activator NlpD
MLRDILISLVLMWMGHGANASPLPVAQCGGALSQGGMIECQGPEGAAVRFGTLQRVIGPDGLVVFGLPRDADAKAEIAMTLLDGKTSYFVLDIAAREDAFRVIEGLDCDKVDARTPEQKEHAGRSWVTKQAGFSAFHAGPGSGEGFVRPAEGRTSSPFGPARKYIGVSAETGESCESVSIHRGYDIAAPIGTPIIAPASGTVVLADNDLYYEGGTVFLDHGHGLLSVFMHMSAIDVSVGDTLAQGEQVGAVGNTGRTTGPHLHWAVKWRDTASPDRGGDFYIDPALLLDLRQAGTAP